MDTTCTHPTVLPHAQVHTCIRKHTGKGPKMCGVQGPTWNRWMGQGPNAHCQRPSGDVYRCYLLPSGLVMTSRAHMCTLLCTAPCSHQAHIPADVLAFKAQGCSQHPLKEGPECQLEDFWRPCWLRGQDQPNGLPPHPGPGCNFIWVPKSQTQGGSGPPLAGLPPVLWVLSLGCRAFAYSSPSPQITLHGGPMKIFVEIIFNTCCTFN